MPEHQCSFMCNLSSAISYCAHAPSLWWRFCAFAGNDVKIKYQFLSWLIYSLHCATADELTWIMWRRESRSSVHTYMSSRAFLWKRAVSAASVSSKLQDSSGMREEINSHLNGAGKCHSASYVTKFKLQLCSLILCLTSYLLRTCVGKHCVWINSINKPVCTTKFN